MFKNEMAVFETYHSLFFNIYVFDIFLTFLLYFRPGPAPGTREEDQASQGVPVAETGQG